MSRFRFTSELPDEQLFQDVLALNLLNAQQLEQFIGILLAFLSERCAQRRAGSLWLTLIFAFLS
jgi:hypothetical protein